MATLQPDNRSPERRARDEQIAAEPPLAVPELPPGTVPSPLESHLRRMVVLYVPLLNEGTDVLRPTTGVLVGPNVANVLPTKDYDAKTEAWEFPPGSTVVCETQVRDGREVLVARRRVA